MVEGRRPPAYSLPICSSNLTINLPLSERTWGRICAGGIERLAYLGALTPSCVLLVVAERLAPAWVHPMHGGSLPADGLPGYTAALRSRPFTFDGRPFGRQLPDGTQCQAP